jgi:circadian clock protein KaiB
MVITSRDATMHAVDDASVLESAQSASESGGWQLRLYVAGQSPRSIAALANLTSLCARHLPGRYTIEVIDLVADPELAEQDRVIVLPTLVRLSPEPLRKITGDLSDEQKVLTWLGLSPPGNG